MAKNSKLNKWRCLLKRWNSSSRITRASSSSTDVGGASARSPHEGTWQGCDDDIPTGFHPVYVGKSRRRYLVRSFLVEHPLFQNLVERSAVDGATVVGCEVVLFEHLLWMLENADPKPESLDELVDFYAC